MSTIDHAAEELIIFTKLANEKNVGQIGLEEEATEYVVF